MKIGVISDTHDRVETVRAALAELRSHNIELLLHCGDIESPPTLELFRDIPTHFVLGNCDWLPDQLAAGISEIGGTLHDRFGHLELDGIQIAWTHSHDRRLFHDLEHCGKYDFLFYGHTHVAEQHQTGKTHVVNPGALHRAREKTCVVLDLADHTLHTVRI